ncbi:Crp/Fnr family transcriptional regulator [Rhodobacteraceae bacterium KMM 6894]|nr:Crp/Fnr family transcriptional regulator [Rhodobacteraceae bacterium KMM 6894]
MQSFGTQSGRTGRDTNVESFVQTYLGVNPQPVIERAIKGRIIVQEDDFADHSILLLEGWIAFSKSLPDGQTQIIDVLLPGDFALIGAVNAPVSACSVEALSDVQFINVRSKHANGPSAEMGHLREMMAGEVVRTQARTAGLLLRMGKGSAAIRIAYALLEFYVRLDAIGRVDDDGFHFPITQQKLGEFTGLSNVHVCRTMRRFERDGIIIHPAPLQLVLGDLDALCGIAGIDLSVFRDEILMHRTALA